jgi:hypothetical protein
MFTQKQTSLLEKPVSKASASIASTSTPSFVKAGLQKSAEILSGNLAVKLRTTGSPFVDQFGKLGSYKAPRDFAQIAADAELQWAESQLDAVKFALYLRTITRNVQLPDGTKTESPQKGGELKHESIMRMIWLHQKAPDVFWKNIALFVSLGSWHDVFTMLQYDLVYHKWEGRVLNWTKFGNLILTALSNKNTAELVKKYLPQIKANSDCKTVEAQANNIIAKWVCSLLFGNKVGAGSYKAYRKLKSQGTAHQWQQLISRRQFEKIEFSEIHGRALNLLVRSKFLHNQKLSEKYAAWVKKPETTVKYTGFVHELFSNLPTSTDSWGRSTGNALHQIEQHVQDTINKQFATLVEKGKAEGTTSLIVVRDTSGSMRSPATGTTQSCFDIAKALALYFSEFLHGKFANSFMEFNSDAKMHTWAGNTPLEKWYNDSTTCVGSTNFESVIKLFAKIKAQGVPESEFPTGILCISDSEFNPATLARTNVESAKKILSNAGFSDAYVSNFVIVLWNLQSSFYGRGTGEKFESWKDTPNTFYFSGYSAATISFLSEKIKTPEELVAAALDQEILNRVTL